VKIRGPIDIQEPIRTWFGRRLGTREGEGQRSRVKNSVSMAWLFL